MKRIISAGLCTAFILSLAGCARQDATHSLTTADTTDTQMGRWVETSIDLGGEHLLSNPAQLDDGTLLLYTGKVGEDSIDSYTRRTSTDGVNWAAEPADFDLGEAMVSQVIPAPDGTLALITYDGENAGLVLQAADGTRTTVEDDTVKGGINPSAVVLRDGELDFIFNGDALDFVQVDLADGSVTTTALPEDLRDGLNALKLVGDRFLYLNFDNNTGDVILNALDPAAGTTTEVLNPVPNATSSQALTGDADGAAYYACQDGIYRLAPGGTLPEQIVPGEGTAMSVASNYPYSLLRTAAGDFMVMLFGDSGSGDLYFYHYDETLPTHADTTLTIWSLADCATARLAMNAYKKAHPEVDVTFEAAVQTDTDDMAADVNDALTQLNTELLAGDGPDLLILDLADYQSYADKGMLADLSDAVPLDELQSNIIAPFVTDGKAYVLPARFSVPAICGAVAHRDIEQDRVRTGGQLLGHDGGRDQRDAADGGGHIAQGVHLLVGDGDFAALADDRNADLVDLPEELLLRQARAGARHSLHLVNRAARVAEAAPAHLGDLDTAGRHNGRNDQRRLVTDAAGGVLVGLDARDGGQIDHVAGVGHDVGQHGGLLVSHAAQVDGHEQRRHLVVGHIACHIAVDGEGQLFMVQRAAVALLGDNIVHSHSFSPCKKQAARLGYRAACCDL